MKTISIRYILFLMVIGVFSSSGILQGRGYYHKHLLEQVKQGNKLDEALREASDGVKRGSGSENIEIFKELFKQDIGFDAAEQAATEGMNAQDCSQALCLFKKLVKQKKSYRPAERAALIGLDAKKDIALSLFIELARQGQCLGTVEQVFLDLNREQYRNMWVCQYRSEEMSLWLELLKQGRIANAEDILIKFLETADELDRNEGFGRARELFLNKLFQDLLALDRGCDIIERAAIKDLKNACGWNGMRRLYDGLELFAVLFEQGKSFNTAEKVAAEGAQSPEVYARLCSLELFEELVRNKKSLETAKKAVEDNLTHEESFIRDAVSRLTEMLSE